MKKDLKLNVVLFYICYTLILISVMFKQVDIIGNVMQKVYQLCIYVLLFICIINLKHVSKRNVLIIYCMIILSFITKYVTKTNTILLLSLIIISFKNIKFDDFVKYDIKIKILFIVIVSIFYFLGYTNVNLHYRNGIIRHSMGFSNPNVFSTYVMSIIIEYLYLCRKNIKFKQLLITGFGIYIIDYFANSRTQICLLILFFILLFIKDNKMNNKIIKFLQVNSFIIMAAISMSIVLLYNSGNKYVQQLNYNTSGRVSSASEIINYYGLSPFGKKIKLVTTLQSKMTGDAVITLDNLYIYLLLSYGVFIFILLCIFSREYIKYTIKNNDNTIRKIIIIFFIGGLMERFCIEITFNIFLLYFSYMIYGVKNIENNKGDVLYEENKKCC